MPGDSIEGGMQSHGAKNNTFWACPHRLTRTGTPIVLEMSSGPSQITPQDEEWQRWAVGYAASRGFGVITSDLPPLVRWKRLGPSSSSSPPRSASSAHTAVHMGVWWIRSWIRSYLVDVHVVIDHAVDSSIINIICGIVNSSIINMYPPKRNATLSPDIFPFQ